MNININFVKIKDAKEIIEYCKQVGSESNNLSFGSEGLGISVHFIPHFEFTFIKDRYGISRNDFPESYKKYTETISLPFYPDMQKDEIDFVLEKVIKVANENRA